MTDAMTPPQEAPAPEGARTSFPNDPDLLSRVLRPYRSKDTRYLKSAVLTVTAAEDQAGGSRLSAVCEFEIPESCYIDDTGHFNSVEFNICYNQMLYYGVAKAVQEKLVPPFSGWTMDDYWNRQLANFLITDFRSTFKRSMRGRVFHGEIEFADIVEWEGSDIRDPLLALRTLCRYWDEYGGGCHGEVRIAITDPPPVPRALLTTAAEV
ncbi:FcoT family thioesterase [Streptomyces sp. NPDC019531]|uniref:FcoT family thioesterase n=1 Tax=Streptomyces sp. NPDC019531 TaxID=3365062 RepID=UPI00384C5619